jgi:hypothetical protein
MKKKTSDTPCPGPARVDPVTAGSIKGYRPEAMASAVGRTARFKVDDDIRSFKEFLQWAKVGRTTAFEMISKGLLRPVRYGKKLLFPHSECIAWLNRLSGDDI